MSTMDQVRSARTGRLPLLLPLLVALVLSGCGGGDDDPTETPGDTPGVTAPAIGATPAPTSAPPASPPPPTLGSTRFSDGLCQARVPAGWIEEAPGSGTTASGNRFLVYGGRLSDDAQWQAAVNAFTAQVERSGATVEQGEGWVRATYPDQHGLAYRARFADRWCDVRLTARTGSLPDGELAAWEGIVASLEPAAAPSP